MRQQIVSLGLAVAIGAAAAATSTESIARDRGWGGHWHDRTNVQLGPRPFFLIDEMADGHLKRKLQQCTGGPFRPSEFSIGHRGAALQFPEHTRESYEAGARMGAGILECDVTFTKDLELVCRHAQNDLHTTTNILLTPLASKCTKPFTPAVLDSDGNIITPASAECRTSDITLAEFKTLTGKMDAFDPRARTPEEFVGGTANFRTDLYAGPTSGHLLTHRESIELFKKLGVKMTPELKAPSVTMPFKGFTQQAYAQKMIDEYKAAGVPSHHVFPQSFNKDDVLYWVNNEPAFGRQAVYLDDANTVPTCRATRI
jgi:glycerophosphoryl diester phosphodiesterase